MGRIIKKSILFVLVFTLTICCASAADICAVMNAYTGQDNVTLFIKNQGHGIDHIYIGNDLAQTFHVEEVGAVRTVVVLDNSLSIQQKYRENIKMFLSELAASRKDGDTFTIATFNKDITYLVEESNDYTSIKAQIDQLQFVNQESYFVNTLYNVVEHIKSYTDVKYTRIIVIADGVDDEAMGYTNEELNDKIQSIRIPIYALGCTGSNAETLKKMFALSRLSNAKSYLMDDMSYADILKDINDDMGVVKVTVEPQAQSCDGTKKSVRVTFGDEFCTADVVMPFKAAASPAEPEPTPEPTPEPAPEPTPEPENTETNPESQTSSLVWMIGAIALTVIIIGVCLFVFLRNKNPKAEEESSSTKPNNDAGERVRITEPLNKRRQTEPLDGLPSFQKVCLRSIKDPAKSFECPFRDSVFIGADPEKCQIVIDSRIISGVHCEIFAQGKKCYVRDGGGDVVASKNGTYVDDRKAVPELPLETGSILKLGDLEFRVTLS